MKNNVLYLMDGVYVNALIVHIVVRDEDNNIIEDKIVVGHNNVNYNRFVITDIVNSFDNKIILVIVVHNCINCIRIFSFYATMVIVADVFGFIFIVY
ncbi:hypothetical protein BACFRA24663_09425 [Bacteroides fragilis]